MELEIKKDNFIQDNFNVDNLLNSFLKNENEAEIFSFKLNIIQREFNTDIEMNMNNLIKASKGLDDDLKNIKLLNDNCINRISESTKTKINPKE
jgi:hypothetical protein